MLFYLYLSQAHDAEEPNDNVDSDMQVAKMDATASSSSSSLVSSAASPKTEKPKDKDEAEKKKQPATKVPVVSTSKNSKPAEVKPPPRPNMDDKSLVGQVLFFCYSVIVGDETRIVPFFGRIKSVQPRTNEFKVHWADIKSYHPPNEPCVQVNSPSSTSCVEVDLNKWWLGMSVWGSWCVGPKDSFQEMLKLYKVRKFDFIIRIIIFHYSYSSLAGWTLTYLGYL